MIVENVEPTLENSKIDSLGPKNVTSFKALGPPLDDTY